MGWTRRSIGGAGALAVLIGLETGALPEQDDVAPVIARIEARPLQDALVSSQSAVRSAEQALQVAEREAERTATLVKGGALPDRDLELARSAVIGAQAQAARQSERGSQATEGQHGTAHDEVTTRQGDETTVARGGCRKAVGSPARLRPTVAARRA